MGDFQSVWTVKSLVELSRNEDDGAINAMEPEFQALMEWGEIAREPSYRRPMRPSEALKWVMASVACDVQTGAVEFGIAARPEDRFRALIGSQTGRVRHGAGDSRRELTLRYQVSQRGRPLPVR